ncbi:cation diffusion facilitator family transporter [Aminobacter aganoensis]|uniref:Cobalt-zinc-cadmium efflux system protein n=2 Tax=Aminobacter aganoensis TaxID=83264 RepID=A0A7X0KM32_9HYPH|nr:cation diffusion facilitator family transporter [Aminobacter aganoensis]MBB6355707.1 cobalt-zinc-cadmium efflux system protein [Aminobacter aganoensis]
MRFTLWGLDALEIFDRPTSLEDRLTTWIKNAMSVALKDNQPAQDAESDHSHSEVVTEANERRIRFVLIFTAAYALIQSVGGWYSGSLALIADSGHMVSDAAALLLALIAYRIARRPADATRTYGYHRVRVLAALANGGTLLLLVAWIAWEAAQRVSQPIEILAGPMLIVAVIGLGVNVAGAYVLWSGNRNDGNLRGALLHVVGDLLGSVGAIAAAVGIMLTGWVLLDPILSILVAGLVIRSAWGLVTDSIRVLLQAVPKGVDAREAEKGLMGLSSISEAGHFHAWTLTDQTNIATVHVSPAPNVDPLELPPIVADWLKKQYALHHVTVQVDRPGSIEPREE